MPRVKTKELPELFPKGKTIADLAKELKAANTAKKKYEALMNQQVSLIHKISVGSLPKLMEDIQGDGLNVPGVGYAELVIEIYPSVKKDDEPEFFDWLRDRGDGDLIKESIHYKTLQAWTIEQIDDPEKAGDLPDILNVGKVPTVKLKAERKKARG